MGLKFRKSIKLGKNVKLNINNNSASVTFGGNGIHHTISTNGTTRTTVGIPGTGISYTTTGGKKKTKK